MEKKSRQALHRGLKALISVPVDTQLQEDVVPEKTSRPALDQIPVSEITANPYQPREDFDTESLDELKDSIQKHGVLEPVILRKSKGHFEIVSGERRLRAVKELGLTTIPAVIREKVSDREMQLFSLIENQLRTDLNDLEIALGYNELINHFAYTHDKIAEDMGKSRPFVSNTLRLLKLPDDIKEALRQKNISSGHARALLALTDDEKRTEIFKKIISQNLSVRQVEKIIQNKKDETTPQHNKPDDKSFDLEELESRLSKTLNTKVIIRQGGTRGKILIQFLDISDLNRIVSLIGKQ